MKSVIKRLITEIKLSEDQPHELEEGPTQHRINDCLNEISVHINSEYVTLDQAFELAIELGSKRVIKYLLEQGVNPAANRNYALRATVEYNHVECLRLLLSDERVDPADLDNVAVGIAAELGHPESLSVLLADPRVNAGDNVNYAIRASAIKGNLEVVNMLLARDEVDPLDNDVALSSITGDTTGEMDVPPINVAVSNGHLKIVELFLNRGCSMSNAMFEACRSNRLEVIKLLLSRNYNIFHNIGVNIQEAHEHQHIEIVDFLCEALRLKLIVEIYRVHIENNPAQFITGFIHIDSLEKQFRAAVNKILSSMDTYYLEETRKIFEVKIIQKTQQQFMSKFSQIQTSVRMPLDLIDSIVSFDEQLPKVFGEENALLDKIHRFQSTHIMYNLKFRFASKAKDLNDLTPFQRTQFSHAIIFPSYSTGDK